MLRHINELGLPFAVLLPTDSMQRVGVGKLLYNYGSSIYVLNPMPRFYVDGEKKNVCSTSWYFGNLPQHKKGKVELFWWPTLANDDKCDQEDQDSRFICKIRMSKCID